MDNNAVALAVIAFAGTVTAGMFGLLNKLSRAIDRNTVGHNKVAKAIEKGNKEAKDRNGHLADLVVQQGENTRVLAETATKNIIKGVALQNVKEQHVEHQEVHESNINKEVK